jgi:type I restriction enzyme S subunit
MSSPDFKPSPSTHYITIADRPGTIPWVKSGELGDRVVYETSETLSDEGLTSSNAKVFPKGTLCIALYGATVGKLGILGVDAATNQAVCAIFPPEGLDTRYLYRFFEGKRRDLIEQGKGGAQSNISQGIIRDTMFPLPPLPEQRRIVAEIEKQFTRLEAGVAALRRVQANLKRYRAAVLKAACEGRLVPTEAELRKDEGRRMKDENKGPKSAASSSSFILHNSSFESGSALLARVLTERRQHWQGRGQYKEPAAPDAGKLPPLPDGWTWASFDQVTTLITKGSSPNWQGFNYCDEGIIFVRSENVRWGTLDLDGVAHLPPGFNEKERKSILREGDVLLNLVGASIGRAAIATAEVDGGNVNQAVAVIRLVAKKTMNQFAMLWLNSTDGQKRIHAEKVDVARANFSLEDTRVLPFPLPPLAEQTRIVAEVERRLSVVEELESVVTADLQRATRLRQSILQRAFTGNLLGARGMSGGE